MPHVAEHPELIQHFLQDLENAWKYETNSRIDNTVHVSQKDINTVDDNVSV